MKKIISLFKRDYEGDRKVVDAVTEGAEWVTNGEGYATRKWDGLAVMIDGDSVYIRYDAKKGRTPPVGFKPAQPEPDPVTLHWPGWVPLDNSRKAQITEALENSDMSSGDGTYELCGPKVGTRHGANPEQLDKHILVPHGKDVLSDCPRDYQGIMEYLRDKNIEGIVFYHPNGNMVKIKKADFPYEDKQQETVSVVLGVFNRPNVAKQVYCISENKLNQLMSEKIDKDFGEMRQPTLPDDIQGCLERAQTVDPLNSVGKLKSYTIEKGKSVLKIPNPVFMVRAEILPSLKLKQFIDAKIPLYFGIRSLQIPAVTTDPTSPYTHYDCRTLCFDLIPEDPRRNTDIDLL